MSLLEFPKRSLATATGPTAAAEVVFPTLATSIVVFRLWLRTRCKIRLGWDDWFIALAQPFFWYMWTTWFYSSFFIVKARISDLTGEDKVRYQKWTFMLFLPYTLTMLCIKLSALFLFLRAFGSGASPIARRLIFAMFALNISLGITRIVAAITFCSPVSDFWNHPDRCRTTFNSYAIAIESISLASEIALLIFPIPIIWKMRAASTRAKLTIYLAFALGSMALLTHTTRIALLGLSPYSVTKGLQDTFYPVQSLVSFTEITLGTCCVSLPALYSPLRLLVRGLKDRSSRDTEANSHGIVPPNGILPTPLRPILAKKTPSVDITPLHTIDDEVPDAQNSTASQATYSVEIIK